MRIPRVPRGRLKARSSKPSGRRRRLFHDAIGFDLNEPRGIDEARNLDKRASRANVTKDLAMRAGGIAPTRNALQHDPRSNDVRYRSPRLGDSFADDFETAARLPVDIAGSCGTSRRCNRSRPCNDDNLANSYGAAKADLGLEIRLRRDEFPWHDASLRWNEATSYRLGQTRSSRLRRRATTESSRHSKSR